MYLANPYVTRVYTRKREDGENKVAIDDMRCKEMVTDEYYFEYILDLFVEKWYTVF